MWGLKEITQWINDERKKIMRTFTLSQLMKEGPETGIVTNEEGPMLPQDFRTELLKIAEEAFSRIRAGILTKERKIIQSFNRSSYREWEFSPHRTLANSLEYLYGQMQDLRGFIEQGSPIGIKVLGQVFRENWTYSFRHVDEELKKPEYNYRNEQQKARARQHHIDAWKARQARKESAA
jgi:hypothetical protein